MSAPWMKFYPRDWRGDQALRAVSVAARGLWIEMLCLMHEASPYGHLILAGRAVSNDVLARVSGLGAEECGALLAELESAGVFSRTRKGVIYSRRMIKDHSRAETGRKSVKKRWAQTPENKEEKAPPNRSPNRKPTTQKPEARRNLSVSARELSLDWQPEPFGDGSRCRAIVDGWPPAERDRQVEKFRAHHTAKGTRSKDWQASWKTWALNSEEFAPRQTANRPSGEPVPLWKHLSDQRQAAGGQH